MRTHGCVCLRKRRRSMKSIDDWADAEGTAARANAEVERLRAELSEHKAALVVAQEEADLLRVELSSAYTAGRLDRELLGASRADAERLRAEAVARETQLKVANAAADAMLATNAMFVACRAELAAANALLKRWLAYPFNADDAPVVVDTRAHLGRLAAERDEWKARAEAAEQARFKEGEWMREQVHLANVCVERAESEAAALRAEVDAKCQVICDRNAEVERLYERVAELDLQASIGMFNLSIEIPSRYRPRTVDAKLGYLVEECGEVLAAAGKTQRWGLDSYNPEVPEDERETNRDWLLRELRDLKRAIYFIETAEEFYRSPHLASKPTEQAGT